MDILESGHVYDLEWLDGSPVDVADVPANRLTFVNREKGSQHAGTQTQEVLRALIDRTKHCDACLRWEGNDQIIYHLRMALALHEARALFRKIEKGECVENVTTGRDGHFDLRWGQPHERVED